MSVMSVYPSGPTTSGRVSQGLLAIGCAFLAVLIGGGVALAGTQFSLAAAGLIAALFCVFLPLSWVLWLIAALTFLVVGQLQYFFGISKAFWIPYLLGALLFFRLILGVSRNRSQALSPLSGGALICVICFALLAAVLAFSSVAQGSSIFQVLVSAKEHFFLWSVFGVLAMGLVSQSSLDGFWRLMLWLAPLQVPMVLYQHFVVAPSRTGGASWDAVVGLFGGNPESGGASGAMALTLVFLSLLAISLWRRELIGKALLALVLTSTLLCIGLAEVKAALILLPLSIALLYRRELFRRPLLAGGMALGAVIASGGLLVAYQLQYAASGSAQAASLDDYVSVMTTRAMDSNYINLASGEMGRLTAIRFWWESHDLSEPAEMLAGHGMGSSRVGQSIVGEAARQYRFRIDRSSMTLYLWESGALGLTAAIGALLASAFVASRGARRHSKDVSGAVCSASAVFLVLVVLLIGYNTDFANVQTIQLLAFLTIGQVILVSRQPSVPA